MPPDSKSPVHKFPALQVPALPSLEVQVGVGVGVGAAEEIGEGVSVEVGVGVNLHIPPFKLASQP